jgi:hypothetical protein
MKHDIDSVKIWSNVVKAADILARQLYIAVPLRPLYVVKCAAGKIIKYDDSPNLFVSDEQIGDM